MSDSAAPTIATRGPSAGYLSLQSMRLPDSNSFWPSAMESWFVPMRDVRVAEAHRLAVTELARAPDGPHGALDREGGWGAMIVAAHAAAVQLLPGDDLGHHADLVRARGRHALVVAQEREPHDLAERHDPRHVDRLERGRHAVRDVRVEERRVLGGDDELDLAEHVERAAAGMPFTAAITGFQRSHALRAEVVARVVEHERRAAGADDVGIGGLVGLAAHLLHAVDAGAERLLAGAGEHDAAHVVVAAKAAPQRRAARAASAS